MDADVGVLVEAAAPEVVPPVASDGGSISIARAADIDGLFEVVGFGQVSEPSGAAQEMEIEVFARMIDAKGRVQGADALKRFWIGCGHFDDFTIGSRWLGGKLQQSRRPEKTYTAEIGRSWIEVLGDCREVAYADRPAPCFSYSGLREAPCIKLPLENSDAPAQVAAVPALELARIVFSVSGRFARQVFDGLRDPALVPDRALFDREESERMSSPSCIQLICNREFTDEEALLAAMLIADPGLRAFHDSLFKSYMVGRPINGPHAAYLDAPAQFPPGTQISFNGRWVDCIGNDQSVKRRFLITRILSIKIPASFKRVEMVYPSMTVNPDAPPEDRWRNRPLPRPISVEVGIPPALGTDFEELPTHGGSVVIGTGVEVVRKPRLEGKRGPQRFAGYKDQEGQRSGSTADRASGGDADVSPISLYREQDDADEAGDESYPPPAPQSLRDTFEALENMCAKNGWRLLPLGTGPCSLRRTPDVRRGWTSVLVAMVVTPSRQILVVDPGTYSGDERSLGLLVPAHGRSGFDPPEVGRILGHWAKSGGHWGGRGLQTTLGRRYVIRPVTRRRRAQPSADLYGKQLGKAVLSLI